MESLSESSKNLFRSSRNKNFRGLVEEPSDQGAVYEQDRIFLGWNRGDKNDLQSVIDIYEQEMDDASRNEVIMASIRQFTDLIGGKREPVFMDRASADVAFDGGERGSGKTFNLRARSNRSAKGDVTNILIDPEHEYFTNNQYHGIQSDLANLRDGEQPERIKTKVLMPHFVWKARKQQGLPEHGYDDDHFAVFKFEFRDLDPNDLDFVMRREFKDHPDFYRFTRELESLMSRGVPIRSWRDVIGVAEELQEMGEFTYQSRAQQIRIFLEHNYQKWGFLGADKKVALKQILNEYNTVVLSLHDDGYLPNNLYMKELYVKFLIKRVRKLVQRDEIPKPVTWTIDEAHEYAPAHTEPDHPPSKEEIKRVIKKDRKRGFRVNLASQEPTDVAGKNFLNQSRHVLIPRNMRPTPRQHLLTVAGLARSGDYGRGKWEQIFARMKEEDGYWWLYVNTEKGFWCVLEPASPLANHFRE